MKQLSNQIGLWLSKALLNHAVVSHNFMEVNNGECSSLLLLLGLLNHNEVPSILIARILLPIPSEVLDGRESANARSAYRTFQETMRTTRTHRRV